MCNVSMKNNRKQATDEGNMVTLQDQEQRWMFSNTNSALVAKQIATNIPYGNKLKGFRQKIN